MSELTLVQREAYHILHTLDAHERPAIFDLPETVSDIETQLNTMRKLRMMEYTYAKKLRRVKYLLDM